MTTLFPVALIVLAFLLIAIGFIGAFLPALPGPPISWAGLLVAFFSASSTLHVPTLVVTAVVMVAVTVADYVFPPMMTAKNGGTKMGSIGSTVGLVAGIILPIPMLGVIVCPFIGALVFELIHDSSDTGRALKAAWGAFLGFLLGTGMKAIVCSAFAWILILNLAKGWF